MVENITNIQIEIINLFKENYLVNYHIREMGKLIKKSHVTLLPHLKGLEKEKILISKTQGKNKIYSLNLDNIITKNYILLTEIKKSTGFLEEIFLIKKIFSEIFNLKLNGTIILFGSYAKKTYKKESDIDILYFGKITESQIKKIRYIGKTYGKTINLKKINDLDLALRKKDPLIIEILKNHIILQSPEVFINSLWRFYHEIKTEY